MSQVSSAPMNESEAVKWIADVFGVPGETITSATERESIALWDSLGTLLLLAAFDETFSITVSDHEIQDMHTVGDVLALLRQRGKLA
jgi:acyl carrier protein